MIYFIMSVCEYIFTFIIRFKVSKCLAPNPKWALTFFFQPNVKLALEILQIVWVSYLESKF